MRGEKKRRRKKVIILCLSVTLVWTTCSVGILKVESTFIARRWTSGKQLKLLDEFKSVKLYTPCSVNIFFMNFF